MLKFPLLALLCLLVYVPAYADNVVINSGTIRISRPGGDFRNDFSLLGTGFAMGVTAHTFAQNMSSAVCPFGGPGQCRPGSSISLNGQGSFSQFDFTGSFTLNNQSYDPLALTMFLSAGDAIIPTTGDATVTLVLPFSVQVLDVRGNGAFVALSGGGNAYLVMSLSPITFIDGPHYKFESLSYVFVPEPSTWILLTTGLTAILFRRRFRGNRRPTN